MRNTKHECEWSKPDPYQARGSVEENASKESISLPQVRFHRLQPEEPVLRRMRHHPARELRIQHRGDRSVEVPAGK